MKMKTWKCYARPARLNGEPCGHVNEGSENVPQGDLVERKRLGLPARTRICAGCGCTKRASDLRKAKSEKS